MSDLGQRVHELLAGLVAGAGPQVAESSPRPDAPRRVEVTAPGCAETVTRLAAMPLDEFAREGQLLEVQVPWHAETLWFVPDEGDAAVLGSEGVGRGRLWTARELMALMALPGRAPGVVRTLALVRVEVDGDLVDVRPRGDGPEWARRLGEPAMRRAEGPG